MTRINTNVSSLIAQTNLQNANNQLQTSLTRLSTGLRINSGADDPAGLIAAQEFGSQITSINQTISNANQANDIVSTASSALAEVSNQLNDIRGLIQASANTGANTPTEIAANQVQLDSALQSIERIGQTTDFGGSSLLNGSKSFNVNPLNLNNVFQSTSDITVNSFDPSLHSGGAAADVTVGITQSATQKTVTVYGSGNGGNNLQALSVDSGSTNTKTTVLGNNGYPATGTNGLASLHTDATQTTQTITAASLASLAGTGAGSLTVSIAGDQGTQSISLNAATLTDNTSDAASTYLAAQINTVSAQTGVSATVTNHNVVLSSAFVGANGTATATATAGTATGTVASASYDLSGFTTGTTGDTYDVDVTIGGTSKTLTVTESGTASAAADIAAAINTAGSGFGAGHASAASGVLTVQNGSTVGAATITVANVAAGSSGTSEPNEAALGTIVSGGPTSTVTGTGTDVSIFNAAVGAAAAGTASAGANTSTFTITGNKGSATIDTSALAATISGHAYTGNDVLINNNLTTNNGNATADIGLTDFANLINTRTGTTGVTASIVNHNLVLTSANVGNSAVASITAANDQGGTGDAGVVTASSSRVLGSTGTSNAITFEVQGDLGNAYVTVNNDQLINDSNVLANAINGVTAQTGVTASVTDNSSGSSVGGNVVLTSQNYGSHAQASLTAVSASNQADVTLIGNAQTADAGLDVAGTVTTDKSSGTFQGIGQQITYNDQFINFAATTAPNLSAPQAATTTVEGGSIGSGGTAGGIGNLTGTGTDTIDFALTGANGQVTNIQGINVAALQGDSRVLVDAINQYSATTGVVASTTANSGSYAGSNIVLTSTLTGANGQVALAATASTNGTDNTVFNRAATQTNTLATGTNIPAAGATATFDVTGGALFQLGDQVNYENQVNVNMGSIDLATLGRDFTTTGDNSLADLATGGTQSLSSSSLTTAANIVNQAITQVSTLQGQLGALQTNVIQSTITSLQASLENVTTAQSDIQDADFASETASLTRAQILVQAGTSVLSIANNRPQSVLALLPQH